MVDEDVAEEQSFATDDVLLTEFLSEPISERVLTCDLLEFFQSYVNSNWQA